MSDDEVPEDDAPELSEEAEARVLQTQQVLPTFESERRGHYVQALLFMP
jgi:hypothetical protein